MQDNTPTTTSVQNHFIDVLVNLGFVDRKKLEGMETKSEEEIVSFLENGICNKEQIARAYGSYFSLPFVILKDKKIEPSYLKMIPVEDQKSFKVIIYAIDNKEINVALGQPKILRSQPPESLKKLVSDGYSIKLSIASEEEIDEIIGNFEKSKGEVEKPEEIKPVEKIDHKEPDKNVENMSVKSDEMKKTEDEKQINQVSDKVVKDGLETVDLTKIDIPREVLLKFPKEVAEKYKMVVFEAIPPISQTKASKKIKVGLLNPEDQQVKEILEFIRKRNNIEIIKYQATEEGISQSLKGYGGASAKSEEKETETAPEKKAEDLGVAGQKEIERTGLTKTEDKKEEIAEEKEKKEDEAEIVRFSPKIADEPAVVKVENNEDVEKGEEKEKAEDGKEVKIEKSAIEESKAPVVQETPKPVTSETPKPIQEAPKAPVVETPAVQSPAVANPAPKEEVIPEIKDTDIDNKSGLEARTESMDNLEENNLDKFLTRPVNSVEDLQSVIKAGMVPEIVAATVSLAIVMQASDIHIEAAAENVRMRYRIDGILKDIIKMPLSLHAPFISRIKILSKLKIDEQRVPQDGRFNVIVRAHEIDLRVSTLPTVHGEKVVMRILDKSAGLITLEDMGITGVGFDVLVKNIKKPYGIILATGPTGSGKSTTLYAVLQRISTNSVNVITLEDPVEYEISGINQVQVKPQIGFTFAEGLRSVLRQDPNIVMVGEIRDLETAAMATHAALTGHLVLSTLHTNDSAGALPRLINMGVEPFLITSSVNCIVAQRLVRRICPKCKEKIQLPPALIESILKEISKIPDTKISSMKEEDLTFYHGKGCPECTNGYHGRMGIYEVLEMNEKIEALAVDKQPASVIGEQACKDGMITMKQDGILKALKGITTIDEVLRVTTSD